MKKLIIGTACFLLFCFFLTFFLDKTPKTASDFKSEAVTSGITYVVKEYKGNISIFKKNEIKPFKITEVYVIDLPKYDRELLREGIIAKNKQELKQILEDYDITI